MDLNLVLLRVTKKHMDHHLKKLLIVTLLLALAEKLFGLYAKAKGGLPTEQILETFQEFGLNGFSGFTVFFGFVSIAVLMLSIIVIILFFLRKISVKGVLYPAYEISWQLVYFLILPLVSCRWMPIDCVAWYSSALRYTIIFTVIGLVLILYSLYNHNLLVHKPSIQKFPYTSKVGGTKWKK